jgi:hypothetical protein
MTTKGRPPEAHQAAKGNQVGATGIEPVTPTMSRALPRRGGAKLKKGLLKDLAYSD